MSDFTGPDQYQKFFDPKAYLERYFSLAGDTVDEYVHFVLKHLSQVFNSGKVKGETLIDIGTGPSIYQLLSACEAFNEIIATDFTERNREEFKAWLTNQPGAFDWSPVVKYACQLEGDRIPWNEKEDCLRKAIKQVLQCDILKDNPTDPVVVPPADCVLSCLCLESACKDQESYITGLNNISTLLKPGGYLVLVGVLGNVYYMVGERKFSALFLTESFIRESLCNAGYVVEEFVSSEKPDESWEGTAQFSSIYVFVAKKMA
ncbi:nicotinamide N-methyltransferase-like [Hyperolius riggenbachi]|uniref:nicotinamide N-methyltransferase-like n=1 Tax=Hyperolius riggenbachi TaxID=752182 RepID=UPI0035A33EC7